MIIYVDIHAGQNGNGTKENPFPSIQQAADYIAHLGDVYLNGKSLYEVNSLEEIRNPKMAEFSWDPEFSLYVWHAQQGLLPEIRW